MGDTAGLGSRSSTGLVALALGISLLTPGNEAAAQYLGIALTENIMADRFLVSSADQGDCRVGVSGPYVTKVHTLRNARPGIPLLASQGPRSPSDSAGDPTIVDVICKPAISAPAVSIGASFSHIWSPFLSAGRGSAAGGAAAAEFIAGRNAIGAGKTSHVVEDVVQFDRVLLNGQDFR